MKKIQLASYFIFFLFIQTLMADLNVNTAQSLFTGDSVSAYENSSDIFVSRQVGGTWFAAVPIGSPSLFPTLPRTAINDADDMVVVWIGYDPSFVPSVYGSYYNGTTWVTTLLSDPTQEYVLGNHQVRIANNGAIVITWASYIFLTGTNEARGIYTTFGPTITWPAAITLP